MGGQQLSGPSAFCLSSAASWRHFSALACKSCRCSRCCRTQSVCLTADMVVRPSKWSSGSRGSWPNKRKWGENPVEVWGVLLYVICLHKLREVLWPLGLLFRGQGWKQIMQGVPELLTPCITTWVIWSGPGLLDATELTQGFHQLRFKVPNLVTVNLLGDPTALEPLVNRHLGHCPSFLVVLRYGLGELWENISENIFLPITSSLKLCEVNCQDFKGLAGKQMTGSCVEHWCMAHSAPLAAADVVPDLSVHGGPVDTRPQ